MQKDFDLRTHIRDPKSGAIIRENPYRLVVGEDKRGNGATWSFERPVGSGLWYAPNGVLDVVKSADGLKRQEQAIRDAKKTELEKANDAFIVAKKRVDEAKAQYDAEQRELASAARRSPSAKESE